MEIGGHHIAAIQISLERVKETLGYLETLDTCIEQIGFEYDILSMYIMKQRPNNAEECINLLKASQDHLVERYKVLIKLKEVCDKYKTGVRRLTKRQLDLDALYKSHGLKD